MAILSPIPVKFLQIISFKVFDISFCSIWSMIHRRNVIWLYIHCMKVHFHQIWSKCWSFITYYSFWCAIFTNNSEEYSISYCYLLLDLPMVLLLSSFVYSQTHTRIQLYPKTDFGITLISIDILAITLVSQWYSWIIHFWCRFFTFHTLTFITTCYKLFD